MCADKKPASASGKEGFEAELKQLEQLVEMGMEEGLQLAMGQMDAILLDA